jgi:hypothetical protein
MPFDADERDSCVSATKTAGVRDEVDAERERSEAAAERRARNHEYPDKAAPRLSRRRKERIRAQAALTADEIVARGWLK